MSERARHRITLEQPAETFQDSFLLGNGSVGAALRGRVGTETLHLNRDTFWSGGPLFTGDSSTVADRTGWLPPLREAIARSDHAAADDLARSLQSDCWTQSFLPVGTIEWHYGPGTGMSVDNYERELDLSTAEARTHYDDSGVGVTLTAFVSAPAAVIVLTSTVEQLELPSFSSSHETAHSTRRLDDGSTLQVWTGRAPSSVLPNYVVNAGAPISYDTSPLSDDGLVSTGMGFAVAVLTAQSAGETRSLIAVVDGFRGRHELLDAEPGRLAERAVALVSRASTKPTAELRQEHRAEYAGYFDRVDLDLSPEHALSPDPSFSASIHEAADGAQTAPRNEARIDAAAAELFFDLGRYLLISSSRPGGQPANLQGIWNDDPRPGWSSNYTTNINLQMNYWPAEAANLSELTDPLRSWLGDLVDLGSRTAQAIYGARGWAVHHNSDIWGFSEPVSGEPQWSNWSTGSLWLVAHLWEHFAYTDDRHFAKTELWPALAGAAVFALDQLEADEDGRLVVSPSSSPEHRFHSGGRLVAVTRGTAMDQELVAETLSRLVALHSAGLSPGDPASADLAAEASTAMQALRPPRRDDEDVLLEWDQPFTPEDRGHRHLSHLYGLFPGESIDEVDTPGLYRSALLALDDRISNGSGHTGWSQSWILCLAARSRNPDLVSRSLDVLVNDLTSTSLLDLHPVAANPTGFLFQIDGNFGAVAGIIEVLVQSQRGVIRVFNAVPEEWANGRLRGVRARGGHSVDLEWEGGQLRAVTIELQGREEVSVCLPIDDYSVEIDGVAVDLETRPAPEGRVRLRIPAESGRGVRIFSSGSPGASGQLPLPARRR